MYHLLLCVFLFTETCGTVRNVDLVSSLPRSKQPRYQVSLLLLLRSGEEEGREWGGGKREREKRGNNRNEVGQSNE